MRCATVSLTVLCMQQEIDAAEEEHARLEMRAGAARQERRQLEAALEEAQLSCAAGQADLAALRKDLAALQAKVAPPALGEPHFRGPPMPAA